MMWQDFVLAAGSILFSVALIPSIASQNKPAWQSSLLTGTILAIFAIVYTTLHLWFSFASTLVTAGLWYVLLYQALKLSRMRGKS
jgi:hypothetical protein